MVMYTVLIVAHMSECMMPDSGPVVQRIAYHPPKVAIWVRFPTGLPKFLCDIYL